MAFGQSAAEVNAALRRGEIPEVYNRGPRSVGGAVSGVSSPFPRTSGATYGAAPYGGSGGGGRYGGGGTSYGGGGYGYNANYPANPYLDKAFKYFEDLWKQSQALSKETYNKEPALEDYERLRAQGLKELQAGAGARGFRPGTGMSLASMQDYGAGTEQGAQGLAGNLWNQGLTQRTALLQNMAGILGGLGGVGQNIAGNQLGLGQLGLGYDTLGTNANLRMAELEQEANKVGLEAQLEAFKYLSSTA